MLLPSPTKAFPDEIGFAMFFAGLAYTGFIAALAVKNCKICKAFLLQNGFNEPELDGVTTYMVLRYASSSRRQAVQGQGVREGRPRGVRVFPPVVATGEDPTGVRGVVDVHARAQQHRRDHRQRDGTKKMKRTASSKRDKVGL